MVVIPKSNGEVRICVDLTKLNESVLREVHPLLSVDYTLHLLSLVKRKSFQRWMQIVHSGKENYQKSLDY